MIREQLFEQFENIFGDVLGVKIYFAPGRVNLIGEHTDYNGGHVFPCALTIGTYAVARKRMDYKIRLHSLNFPDEDNWKEYPKGVIQTLKEKGYDISYGMDILYYGNIPNSSGLSSSASIEVLTAFLCKDLFDLSFTMHECAEICQYSENHYNGVNCGIMDQFSIAMGKKNQAIFLNTSSMKYEYVDINLFDAKIVIMNTNKKRGLGDSKYNERRKQCEDALVYLQKKIDIYSLGELDEEQWNQNQCFIEDLALIKIARHAVMENQRTIKAVAALKQKDLALFGQLMNESHDSLRDDYEVTGLELDTLVNGARNCQGVIGARMTGAGFGGCAVAIVKEKDIKNMMEQVGKLYRKEIGYQADFYVVEIGDGPKCL